VLTVQRVVVPLRLVLVAGFLLLLMLQSFSLPGQFAHMADEHPDLAHLRWPMTVFSVLLLVCAQVVIVGTWQLLSMVTRDTIFSEAAFGWVDTIIGAIGGAGLILIAILVWLFFTYNDPGMPVLLTLLLVGVSAVGLLMVVMRALLRQATTLRTDMDAVI